MNKRKSHEGHLRKLSHNPRPVNWCGLRIALAPSARPYDGYAMPMMFAVSLVLGLLLLSALLRLCAKLAARTDLPWGRAFGLSALISLVYQGLKLAFVQVTGATAPPFPPIFWAVPVVSLLATAVLSGWIVRDPQGQPIGFVRGTWIAGLLFLFMGVLTVVVFFAFAPAPQ